MLWEEMAEETDFEEEGSLKDNTKGMNLRKREEKVRYLEEEHERIGILHPTNTGLVENGDRHFHSATMKRPSIQ